MSRESAVINNLASSSKPRWFVILLVFYPLVLSFLGWSPRYGFLTLPRFGEHFYPHTLPVIQSQEPPRKTYYGYDGQFYVQMAVDPTLRNSAFKQAIDDVGYRGQRIGLSAIAYVLGFGQPFWIVQIYCCLNFVFWCLLCWLVLKQFPYAFMEQRLGIIAIVWTAGGLVSLTRALTDLPAAALGLLAVYCASQTARAGTGRAGTLLAGAASMLCKETGLLSMFALIDVRSKRAAIVTGLLIGVMVVPLLIWIMYVKFSIGSGESALGNFQWPLKGLFDKAVVAVSDLWNEFPSIHVVELVGPISIMVQVAYVLSVFDWRSPVWRFGAGFAILAMIIAFPVWETQTAFSRVLLPLTIAFNMHLMQRKSCLSSRVYWSWFWWGNVGLLDRALPMMLVWLAIEVILRRRATVRFQASEA